MCEHHKDKGAAALAKTLVTLFHPGIAAAAKDKEEQETPG
jgi:hypothetical protein